MGREEGIPTMTEHDYKKNLSALREYFAIRGIDPVDAVIMMQNLCINIYVALNLPEEKVKEIQEEYYAEFKESVKKLRAKTEKIT